MRFIHLSDLHLGRRVHEFSMIEDQRFILTQVLGLIDKEQPQAVLLAGDLYDKAVPSVEAVELLDWFLTELTARRLPVLAVSGNHDSGARLSFGSRIMRARGVHLAGSCGGTLERVALEDEYGPVYFYLLPFVRTADVRPFLEEDPKNLQDAVLALLAREQIDPSARNVLVAHQFVTAGAAQPRTCDSEAVAVGGVDSVDASVFSRFDYVALGHLHRPQTVGSPHVRYCGTPLKYSFSEWMDQKSVTLAELGSKGTFNITALPLKPRRDLRELRGTLDQLLRAAVPDSADDYIHAVLTDEEELIEPMARIRSVYPNTMRLSFDNSRTRAAADAVPAKAALKPPLELFCEFYELQNGMPLDGRRRALAERLLKRSGGAAL